MDTTTRAYRATTRSSCTRKGCSSSGRPGGRTRTVPRTSGRSQATTSRSPRSPSCISRGSSKAVTTTQTNGAVNRISSGRGRTRRITVTTETVLATCYIGPCPRCTSVSEAVKSHSNSPPSHGRCCNDSTTGFPLTRWSTRWSA